MATKKSFVKKITTKECGIIIPVCEEILARTGKETAILRVVGKVKKSSGENGDLGPYQRFEGEFAAVNLSTGVERRSDKLILPPVAEMLISQAFAAERENDPQAPLVFGIDITILPNPSAKGGTKFKYGVIAHKSTEQKDGLDLLMEEIGDLPLLPAPDSKSSKK